MDRDDILVDLYIVLIWLVEEAGRAVPPHVDAAMIRLHQNIENITFLQQATDKTT